MKTTANKTKAGDLRIKTNLKAGKIIMDGPVINHNETLVRTVRTVPPTTLRRNLRVRTSINAGKIIQG